MGDHLDDYNFLFCRWNLIASLPRSDEVTGAKLAQAVTLTDCIHGNTRADGPIWFIHVGP